LVYNQDTMQTNSSPEISKVARDPRLFVWFVTLIVAIIYVVTLINSQSVRQPVILLIFSGLTLIHIVLHWQLGRFINQPRKTTWYILAQGALAFAVLLFAKNFYMTIALFMIMIGEAIGLFGLTRRGIFAAIYFGTLLAINLIFIFGWDNSGTLLLSTIPILVFVILSITLYMRQNEAREQAQSLAANLEAANRQLSEYAVQVEELTLATERQRMARELHDTLSQGLSGLVLQLEAIKAHLEAGRGERALVIIDQSLARARSTLANSRAAIDDLRVIPASLPEAMRAKSERFTQATGIPCELNLSLGRTAPSPYTGEHLLNVLNEALANITRHAQANQVWVRLEAIEDRLELEVRDNGKGFDSGKAIEAGHYGLLGMRERARLVGGTLEIKSEIEQGTRIRLILPIPQDN
jgi:NarL family two-component system sensor histidine kinase YdfH